MLFHVAVVRFFHCCVVFPYGNISQFIHVNEHLGFSSLGLWCHELSCFYLSSKVYAFLLGMYLGLEFWVKIFVNMQLYWIMPVFQNGFASFYSTATIWEFPWLPILYWYLILLLITIPVILLFGYNTFLWWLMSWARFHLLFWPFGMSLLLKCLFKSFPHLSVGIYRYFFHTDFVGILYSGFKPIFSWLY